MNSYRQAISEVCMPVLAILLSGKVVAKFLSAVFEILYHIFERLACMLDFLKLLEMDVVYASQSLILFRMRTVLLINQAEEGFHISDMCHGRVGLYGEGDYSRYSSWKRAQRRHKTACSDNI